MLRRALLKGVAATAAAGLGAGRLAAQEVLKMGVSIPMTGRVSTPSAGNWRPRSSFTCNSAMR